MQVKLMAKALPKNLIKLDDLSVLWCINHIEYEPLEHIFWLQSMLYTGTSYRGKIIQQIKTNKENLPKIAN